MNAYVLIEKHFEKKNINMNICLCFISILHRILAYLSEQINPLIFELLNANSSDFLRVVFKSATNIVRWSVVWLQIIFPTKNSPPSHIPHLAGIMMLVMQLMETHRHAWGQTTYEAILLTRPCGGRWILVKFTTFTVST